MRLAVECRFAPCSATPRLAVRHAARTIEHGEGLFESFAPDAFGIYSRGAPFQLSHDGPVVGHVVNITDAGQWLVADAHVKLEDDDPVCALAREMIRPGARVSPGFTVLREDRTDMGSDSVDVVRYEQAHLDEISLVKRGDIPGYLDARITAVRELPARKPSPAVTSSRAAGEDLSHHASGGVLVRHCGVVTAVGGFPVKGR